MQFDGLCQRWHKSGGQPAQKNVPRQVLHFVIDTQQAALRILHLRPRLAHPVPQAIVMHPGDALHAGVKLHRGRVGTGYGF